MDLAQLQAQLAECQELENKYEKKQQEMQREMIDANFVKNLIRQRRIQISSLHYEAKNICSLNIKKKRYEEEARKLSAEITFILMQNTGKIDQLNKLTDLCILIQRKLANANRKIAQIKAKTQRLSDTNHQNYLSNKNYLLYLQLCEQVQHETVKSNAQIDKFKQEFALKRQLILYSFNKIGQIDDHFSFIDWKLKIQQNIIRQLKQADQKTQNLETEEQKRKQQECFVTLEQKEKVLFRTEMLELHQQTEISKIMLKESYEKEKEKNMIGRIVRQNNHKTQHFIKKFRKSQSRGFTQIGTLTLKDNLKQSSSFELYQSQNEYSQRWINLQKNKRVRTRQTEINKKLQVHNNNQNKIIQNEELSPTNHHQKSIVDVYENLLKNNWSKKLSNGIQIIKLKRFHNRTKKFRHLKGVAQQCEQIK